MNALGQSGPLGKNFGQSNVKANKDFFVNAFTVSGLASGASATRTIQIEADSDFLALKMTYFANIAAAVQTDSSRVIPLVRVQVQDTGSGRNLFNQAVPMSTIMGQGDLPFIIPMKEGRLFKSNSGITFTLTNFAVAGTTYEIDIVLSGIKTWD